MPPNTWISMTALKLASANRSQAPSACTSRAVPRCANAHSIEREVDDDIIVAGGNEGCADAAGAGADVQQPRGFPQTEHRIARWIASGTPSGSARWRSKVGAVM